MVLYTINISHNNNAHRFNLCGQHPFHAYFVVY